MLYSSKSRPLNCNNVQSALQLRQRRLHRDEFEEQSGHLVRLSPPAVGACSQRGVAQWNGRGFWCSLSSQVTALRGRTPEGVETDYSQAASRGNFVPRPTLADWPRQWQVKAAARQYSRSLNGDAAAHNDAAGIRYTDTLMTDPCC